MQSVSINGYQIHSNTTDLGFVLYTPVVGLEFPDIRFVEYDKPGEHGAIVASQFFSGRSISLMGRVSGNSINQYLLNRRTLMSLLRIVLNSLNQASPLLLTFTTLDGLSLQISCYANNKPTVTERSLNHADFSIDLYAPDYNLYDQSLQNISISAPSGGGVTYPVIYPVTYSARTGGSQVVTNNGDSDVFPVISFYGPFTNPFVTNQTLGVSFQVNTVLSVSDVLVVDMANKTMVLNGTQSLLSAFVLTNTWLSLSPGNNTIIVGSGLSSDTGYINIAFRNAYIGI